MDLTVLFRIERAERAIKLRDAAAVALYLGVGIEQLYKKQRGVLYSWE